MSFEWLSTADRQDFLGYLEARFGIPQSRFDGHALFRRGEYINALGNEAARISEGFECLDGGIHVARVTGSGAYKPVTRGVQVFGDAATRNVIEVSFVDIKALVEGRRVEAPEYQGFVLLRFEGKPIGVGLVREGRLESQFPRSLTEHLVLFPAADLCNS